MNFAIAACAPVRATIVAELDSLDWIALVRSMPFCPELRAADPRCSPNPYSKGE